MEIGRVKICCHTCEGVGEAYPSRKEIKVLCPECNGDKFVYADVKT